MIAQLEQLETIEHEVNPQNAAATMRVMQQLHPAPEPAATETRGLFYGPDRRNVLNVFQPASVGEDGVPVVVFIHGGNFVAGHCEVPGTPFYDNIGRWAAAGGRVGITLTYRLAPGTMFPGGTDDVADALEWVLANAERLGGDPDRVTVIGTSAGGIHLALALSRRPALDRIAALAFVSCLYDLASVPREPVLARYFPDDVDLSAVSPIDAILASDRPVLLTVSERDPAEYQQQFDQAVARAAARPGVAFARLHGHNHFSAVLELGIPGSQLADALDALVAAGGKSTTRTT